MAIRHPAGVSRRQLLKLAGTAGAASLLPLSTSLASDGWYAGELAHLLPAASDREILLKASFTSARERPPELHVDHHRCAGEATSSCGRFWQFRCSDLEAATEYVLRLFEGERAISDSWPLRTFPDPDDRPEHVRLLAYTCAGGDEAMATADGTHFFLSLDQRQALLERGLAFAPDIVIANGDHIYWDQLTSQNKPEPFAIAARNMHARYGALNPALPALNSANEAILTRIGDAQIARLYGVRLRSTPSFFLTDDHDLFENDEASDELFTLPPDRQQLDLARSTQRLYYPEFLPDANRPAWLPGDDAADRWPGCSETFGTLRYGRLLEALLYDTKRYATLKGTQATLVPPRVERWLAERTAAKDIAQLLHIPSTPMGWSAGKWGEWYPDVLPADGSLGTGRSKPYWPRGWWSQHQRILQMFAANPERAAVVMSGDLHAFCAGEIRRSGNLDLAGQPLHALCVGPLGSGAPAFPSFIRATPPQPPSQVLLEQAFRPLEKNGFSIVDVTPERIEVQMFAWRPPEPTAVISALEPFHTYRIERP